MKLKSILFAALALGLASFSVPANAEQGNQRPTDHDAVIAAAYDYAFGIAEGSRERLERAFAMDQAQLKLVLRKDGRDSVFIIPIRDLMEQVWLTFPKSTDHFVEIIELSVIEGTYATITINNNNEFFDRLSLYKLNGEWKIVDKLAMRHPEAAPSNFDMEAIFGSQVGTEIAVVPLREK